MRVAALLLVTINVGMPIDDLPTYALLVGAALLILTGTPRPEPRRWLAAIVITGAIVAAHLAWSVPLIEEGHNVFLPGPSAAKSLPADVLKVLDAQFAERYPPDQRCADIAQGCWRPDRSAEADGYAFSADAIFQQPAFSRRVAGIDFGDPAHLRLGVTNELTYGWPDHSSDIMRFDRDRRSLALFDRYRITLPLFVVYRFPQAFVGSRLCWHGTVLWERGDGFEDTGSATTPCRDITDDDVGRRIYGLSILPDARLGMMLVPNRTILLRRALASGLAIAGVIGVVLVLVRIEPRRLALPAVLIALTLVLVVFIDAQFIGGFRPLDSGDDGLTYEGYGRRIVRHLLSGDFAAAWRGEENIYFFAPGMRYLRALEQFLFGDTFLGYLTMILVFPLIVHALFARFLTPRWALVIVLLFVATPIGALFGSSLFYYVVWASRGFADPLAFILLFAAIVLVVPPRSGELPGVPRLFSAGLLFAAATFCRPNLLLASAVMVGGAGSMWLWQRRAGGAAALGAGFCALAVSPLHNYVFGHVFVPFTTSANLPQTLVMPPLDYVRAVGELLALDFTGDHVRRAATQLAHWLSGPQDWLATVPLNALGVATLLRVGLFGGRFDPWLRLIALATLIQHGIGICYINFVRYNLGTWLLTLLVAAAWLQGE
ncbi:MAG: hypothetical protein JO228_12825, partial [Xanthobacteraceae bacterium]|nr:hypothetical protein [Xanthobacteraceae bacterium]